MLSISECRVDKLGEKEEPSNGNNFLMYRQHFRTCTNIIITICTDRQFILFGRHSNLQFTPGSLEVRQKKQNSNSKTARTIEYRY